MLNVLRNAFYPIDNELIEKVQENLVNISMERKKYST